MSFPWPLPPGPSGLLLAGLLWISEHLRGTLAAVDDTSAPIALAVRKWMQAQHHRQAGHQCGCSALTLLSTGVAACTAREVCGSWGEFFPKYTYIDLSRTPSLVFSQVLSTWGEYTDKVKSGGFFKLCLFKDPFTWSNSNHTILGCSFGTSPSLSLQVAQEVSSLSSEKGSHYVFLLLAYLFSYPFGLSS